VSDVDIAKQSARGTFVLFLGNFVSTAILAISAIVIARLLGPDLYGVYSLAILIPSLFLIFVGVGVDTAITRFAAYHLSRGEVEVARRVTVNSIIFMSLMGIVLTLASLLSASFLTPLLLHRPTILPLVQLSCLFVLGQTLLQITTAVLIGWRAMGLASITAVIQAAFKTAVATVLIVSGFGVFGALVGDLGSFLFAGFFALIAIYVYELRGQVEHGRFFSDIRDMTSFGVPVYAGAVISGFASKYLTILLAAVASNVVIGFFRAASNLTVAISLASSAITQALFPAFASLYGKNSDMPLAFKYSVKYAGYVTTPVIFFLVGAAGVLVEIFGPSYSGAAIYLQLLALSNLPMLVGLNVIPPFFNGLGNTRMTLFVNIVGSAAMVLSATLLTGIGLGAKGLIFAILLSNAVSVALGLVISARLLRSLVDFKAASFTLAASVISYAAIYPVQNLGLDFAASLVIDIALFAAAYLTILPLLRGVDEQDVIRLDIAFSAFGHFAKFTSLLIRYERIVLRVTSRRSG